MALKVAFAVCLGIAAVCRIIIRVAEARRGKDA